MSTRRMSETGSECSRGSRRRSDASASEEGLQEIQELPELVVENREGGPGSSQVYEKKEEESSGFFSRLASVVVSKVEDLFDGGENAFKLQPLDEQAAVGGGDDTGPLQSFQEVVPNDDMREIMAHTSAAALPYTRAQAGLDTSQGSATSGVSGVHRGPSTVGSFTFNRASSTAARSAGGGRYDMSNPSRTSPSLIYTRPTNPSTPMGGVGGSQSQEGGSVDQSGHGSVEGVVLNPYEAAMAGSSFGRASSSKFGRMASMGGSMRNRMRPNVIVAEPDRGQSGWMEIQGGDKDPNLLASRLMAFADSLPDSMKVQVRITPNDNVSKDSGSENTTPILTSQPPTPGGGGLGDRPPRLSDISAHAVLEGGWLRAPRFSDASCYTAVEDAHVASEGGGWQMRPPRISDTSAYTALDGGTVGKPRPIAHTQSEPVMQVGLPTRRRSIELVEVDGNYFQRYTEEDAILEEEMYDRREFLVALAASLHKFGAATHLTEALIKAATEKLRVPAQCSAFPSLLLISFNNKDMDPSRSQTRSLALTPSMNLDKLDSLDELACKIIAGDISFQDARDELQAILLRPKNYSKPQIVFAYALAAWSSSILFYGGSWINGLFAIVLGCVGGGISWLATYHTSLAKIEEFVVALVCSLLARFIHRYINTKDTCFFAMILSAILWYLPGLGITTAVTELANKSVVSGSSRLFSATIVALQLGFGLAIGSRAVLWDAEGDNTPCEFVVPTWFAPIGFFGLTTALMMLNNLKLSANTVGVYGSASAGFMMSMFLETKPYITSDTRSFICAFAVGTVGGLWSRMTHKNNLSTIVCGILLLVPGGIGVRGVQAFMRDDVISGLQLGFKMFTVALSITVGLLVAKMAVSPVRRIRGLKAFSKGFAQPTLF